MIGPLFASGRLSVNERPPATDGKLIERGYVVTYDLLAAVDKVKP